MPLPPRRKRCSFGGKEGVWWRRKTRLSTEVGVAPPSSSTTTTSTTCHEEQLRACTTTTTAVLKGTPEPSSATMISEKKSNDGVSSLQPLQQEGRGEHCHDTSTTAVVDWDEALARPIYRRNNNAVGVCDNNQVSSSSTEEESGDDDENSAPDVSPAEEGRLVLKRARSSTATADSPSRWGVRRTKTFRGRSRRPLSLLLSQHDNFALDSSSTSSSSNPEDPPLVPSTVPLFEVNDRRGLDDEEEDSHGTASGEEVPVDHAHATEETLDVAEEEGTSTSTSSASSSDSSSPGASEPSPFEFSGGDDDVALHTATVATKTSTPMRPTANSSIEQAKLYFEHLDGASCRLQLDSSASPANSRPGRRRGVIRTTRKIQLSSPGFVKEYSKYAQAVQEMGVSPLKTVDYAKSRREFFRKAELFDGFVDS